MNKTNTTSCVSSPSPPTTCMSSPSPPEICVTSPPPPKSVLCVESVDTYLIETPATLGVPWVDITPDDAGKFLSNDGERAYWQTVAYTEENFTTILKEELESLISGDYSWKENQW